MLQEVDIAGLPRRFGELISASKNGIELLAKNTDEFDQAIRALPPPQLATAKTELAKAYNLLNMQWSPRIEPVQQGVRNKLIQVAKTELQPVPTAGKHLSEILREAVKKQAQHVEQNRGGLPLVPPETRQMQPAERKKHLSAEQQHRIEVRKKHHELMRWAIDSDFDAEKIEQLLSITNLNGNRTIEQLPDDEFMNKHGSALAIFTVPKKGEPQIVLRASDYQLLTTSQLSAEQVNGRDKLLQALRHEVFHMVDLASNSEFSQELIDQLGKTKEGKQLVSDFAGQLSDDHKNWWRSWTESKLEKEKEIRAELLAHLLAGSDEPKMNQALRAIENHLNRDFLKTLKQQMQNKVESLDPSYIDKTAVLASNVATSDVTQAERNEILDANKPVGTFPRFEFNQRVKTIRKKLNDVKRDTSALVTGRDEYVEHIEDVLRRLHNDIKQEEPIWENILGLLIEIDTELNDKLGVMADYQQSQLGFFEDAWQNTTFLTIADMGRMFTTTREYMTRRHERKSNMRAGTVGYAMLNNTPLRTLASDFNTKLQTAEADEVEQYKKALNQQDPWQIMDVLESTNNQDELKACLFKLADDGAIDWRDRRIWKAIQRFQSSARFVPSDEDNPIALRAKLNRALSIIYDKDFFQTIERTNKSNVDSRKNEYAALASADTNYKGSLADMLEKRVLGENVDPNRYFSYVELDIKASNTDPVLIFWNMIQGVRTGLLSIENLKNMEGANHNQYAPIRWFGQVKATSSYLRSIGEVFFDPSQPGTMPDSFYDWFYTHVMTVPDIKERIIKSAATGGWDHDMAVMQGSIGTANTAKSHFGMINVGKPQQDPTAYPNMMVGMLMYTSALARYPQEVAKEDDLFDRFAEQMEYTTAYIAYGTGKMFNTGGAYTREKFHTLGSSELDGRARMASAYGSGKMTKGKHFLNSHHQIVDSLNLGIMDFLNETPNTPEEEKFMAKRYVAALRDALGCPNLLEGLDHSLANKEGVLQSMGQILRNYYKYDREGALAMMNRAFSTTRTIYAESHAGKVEADPFKYAQAIEKAKYAERPYLYS